jgi:hypothetical protein
LILRVHGEEHESLCTGRQFAAYAGIVRDAAARLATPLLVVDA